VASLVRQARPNVLLLDLSIEAGFDALSTVRHLRADFPEGKICVLSAYLEPSLGRDLLKAGAYGYILKDDDQISRIDTTIRDLAEGRVYLSPSAYQALAQATRGPVGEQTLSEREVEILRLAKRDLPNPQIAQALHTSPGSVRNHLSSAYRKLGVHSRHQALQTAEQRRLL